MNRSHVIGAVLSLCVGVGACADRTQAGVAIAPPPGPARIAKADAVVVGKVEALEPVDIKVGNETFRIAVVRINDGIKGTNGEKKLRVGFTPIMKPANPMIFVSGPRPMQLEPGTEGLFILAKHGKEKFHVLGGMIGYFISSANNKEFAKDVESAKIAAKVAADPRAALKSKDADERLHAAAILIQDHRTYRGNAKQEPIDAEESKQLMQIMADGDWKTAWNFGSLRPIPGHLFQQLHVSKADGFAPPTGGDYQAAVQAWVRDHIQTYRIQRFVAAPKN